MTKTNVNYREILDLFTGDDAPSSSVHYGWFAEPFYADNFAVGTERCTTVTTTTTTSLYWHSPHSRLGSSF